MNQGGNPASKNRIETLDGFRALAIFMVIAFHYLCDPSQFKTQMLYPFGLRYVSEPLVRYGYLGVNLFFIISGFVIAMTLRSTGNGLDFAVKRLARLFPPMLLCTLITYVGLQLLPQRVWQLHPGDLLPGLTFIDDFTWRAWLGPHVHIVDNAYWTLFVEVKFYLLAGTLYYVFRGVPLLISLGVAFNLVWIAGRFPAAAGLVGMLKLLTVHDKLPWFLAGVGFWSLSQGVHRRVAALLIVQMLALLVFRLSKHSAVEPCFAIAFFALFVLMIYAPRAVRIFAWKPLTLIGASSYGTYLLHNRLGVSITHAVSAYAPQWLCATPVLPGFVAAVIIGFAMLLHRYWELPAQRATLLAYADLRTRVERTLARLRKPISAGIDLE